LQGSVRTSFANAEYVQGTCQTPITTNIEDSQNDLGTTCIQIEHAAQAYHNYQRWLSHWATSASGGNGSAELKDRPKGWAILEDNTTVTAPWIDEYPVSLWKPEEWVINNVTLAFPHPGLVQAAQDPANGIMQPNELNGLGIYSIKAAIPSPFVNVLCVMGMDRESLRPLIFDKTADQSRLNVTEWPHQLNYSDPYRGGTPFDDIFKWGEKYGYSNWPPVFAKYPLDYNTIANDTIGTANWGRTTVYVLGKGGPTDTNNNYALCELRAGQNPNCSTQYTAASNVATLEAQCGPGELRYSDSVPNAVAGVASISTDWPNVASMWVRSINMNSGLVDGDASNARLWSQLIMTNTTEGVVNWKGEITLNMNMPSPAEVRMIISRITML
jgi:hypothetical protein